MRKSYGISFEAGSVYGESFGTIAGYAAHGAIVHYSATPESNSTIEPKGLLLIDSGAQFMHGTTDITRTVALGEITPNEKDYTKVLKGHIALATAIYPEGTRGRSSIFWLANHCGMIVKPTGTVPVTASAIFLMCTKARKTLHGRKSHPAQKEWSLQRTGYLSYRPIRHPYRKPGSCRGIQKPKISVHSIILKPLPLPNRH